MNANSISTRKSATAFLYLPCILSVGYLLLTLLLYAFGPFAWETKEPVFFYVMIFLYITAFALGYYLGISINKPVTRPKSNYLSKRILRILPLLMMVNIVFIILNIFRDYGYSSLDFVSLSSDLISGLSNLGDSYNAFQEKLTSLSGQNVIGGRLMTVANLVWDFVKYPIILLGLIYFQKLKLSGKILAVASCVLEVMFYVSIGTNIGVFRIALAVVIIFLLVRRNTDADKSSEDADKDKHRALMLVLVAVAIILCFFVLTMVGRGGILNWDTPYYNVGGVGLNRDSIFFAILPEGLYIPFISLCRYLTSGYYGLSLCMSLPWIPTFGLGSSYGIIKLLDDHGTNINHSTYQYRAQQYNWDENEQWHSMFSWLANDVSFVGVAFFMLLVGICFAKSFRDSIETNNPFAIMLVFYFTLMMFFAPCNNQIFQSTGTLFSFVLVMFCWLHFRRLIYRT